MCSRFTYPETWRYRRSTNWPRSLSILVTRNLQLQATFQQDLALAVTMERALFLAKVIGCDLAQAVSMTGTISLARVAPIDLTCNMTAPRSISFDKLLPVNLTRTVSMSSALVIERVAKIDAALTVTMARACTLGYPPGGLPVLASYTTAGAFTHNIVRNCDFMDCVGCGAGGGGVAVTAAWAAPDRAAVKAHGTRAPSPATSTSPAPH